MYVRNPMLRMRLVCYRSDYAICVRGYVLLGGESKLTQTQQLLPCIFVSKIGVRGLETEVNVDW